MTNPIQSSLNGGAVFGAWAAYSGLLQDWLGSVAAFLSIVWFLFEIYNMISAHRKK